MWSSWPERQAGMGGQACHDPVSTLKAAALQGGYSRLRCACFRSSAASTVPKHHVRFAFRRRAAPRLTDAGALNLVRRWRRDGMGLTRGGGVRSRGNRPQSTKVLPPASYSFTQVRPGGRSAASRPQAPYSRKPAA